MRMRSLRTRSCASSRRSSRAAISLASLRASTRSRPGSDACLSRSLPTSVIPDTAERAWAAEWVTAILGREGVTVTPEAKEHLWSALNSLASAPVAERTLTGLSVLLQSGTLKRALQPYCVGGAWGRLLDA